MIFFLIQLTRFCNIKWQGIGGGDKYNVHIANKKMKKAGNLVLATNMNT